VLAEATGRQQLFKTDPTRLLLIGAEVGSESVRTVATSLTGEVQGCVTARHGSTRPPRPALPISQAHYWTCTGRFALASKSDLSCAQPSVAALFSPDSQRHARLAPRLARFRDLYRRLRGA
jgi:hypothetical protein